MTLFSRHVASQVRQALDDTPVVLLAGPRQAGKTTLARAIAADDRAFVTLDNATSLEAAHADPTGFIRNLDRAVIDEAQRAPDLLLAIKESIDLDRRPGRFLLTGSANLMAMPLVADSLAGRMETIRLLPLAQAEIMSRRPSHFLETLFSGKAPRPGPLRLGADLVEIVLAGGYPEALARRSWPRRQDWYRNYTPTHWEGEESDCQSLGYGFVLGT